jgi:LPXTG-site transpeptidase (sortase) family protein
MAIGEWISKARQAITIPPGLGRRLSSALVLLGALFFVAAVLYAGYALATSWLMRQDRYLLDDNVALLPVPTMTVTPGPLSAVTALPTPTSTPTPAPTAALAPARASPAAPVQIRIPAIGVSRSIVSLPRSIDERTGAVTWDTRRLFRSGRSDLVGLLEGSAYPGEQGNMILVGHNYGYGYNGVFVRLGRLKAGHKVVVVNKAGQAFTYQVTEVRRLKWREKDFAELAQHLSFLASGGPERVTLVSCAGAQVEPFPERIYVVAEPVR